MLISSVGTKNVFVCANCKREADKSTFKLCSGCNKVHYCNRECQVADRSNHKAACKATKINKLNPTRMFSNYCSNGDLEGLQRLISEGADFSDQSNQQIYDAFCSLMIGRYYECAELVLQHNVNPNVQNVDGLTPLYMACNQGFDDFLTLFLRYKANVNIRNMEGVTPLNISCHRGYDKCVSLLLQHNADVNATNDNGYSSLHVACQNDHDKCIVLLLQHKADPNIVDRNNGISPLHVACQYGHDKCASFLLKHNANPDMVSIKDGISPLEFACLNRHPKCVLLLLQYNANPNIANIKDGLSPLHRVCSEGSVECLSLLLQHNAVPNIVSNKDGDCPLHLACQNGHDKCASLLLQYNANPNIVNSINGYSPLHRACQNGHDKCVSLLLNARANLENINQPGFTPFLTACYCGHLKCAAMLVEHGANIHFQSVPHQKSALHLSCVSRNFNLVVYILSLGVDVNKPDMNGVTPIQYCHTSGLEKCVKLLIEHGADESTIKSNIPVKLFVDSMRMNKDLAKTKELRQKAKHCDYPDCCNEGNDSQSLHACSSCRAVYYCSREHQVAHWKEHKKLCKAIKK